MYIPFAYDTTNRKLILKIASIYGTVHRNVSKCGYFITSVALKRPNLKNTQIFANLVLSKERVLYNG
jgi:hypothetical protein